MNLKEGLIVVLVIIIIIFMIKRKSEPADGSVKSHIWDCIDRNSGNITSVKMQYKGHESACKCPKCSDPEKNSTRENAEFFSSGCSDDAKRSLEMCGDGDKFEYAINEFGAPGRDYKDWITGQAVDPQVIKNHSEFVKDRTSGNTQNITGRTYSPDSHDSAQEMPWMGLRRPQAVPICNPTQVPDMNYDWFEKKPRFTWSST